MDGIESGVVAIGTPGHLARVGYARCLRDRRALRAVALQFWMNGVVFASFIPRLPEIRDRIGTDLRGLGLLLTLGSLGGLVGSAACGPVIERFGTKRSMIGGALGLIATLPLIGLADGAVVFLIGLALLHLFDVVTDVAMNLQGSWLSARRKVPVISRLHGLWSVGTVIGGVGATLAASTISLRLHLLVVAVLLLATLLYVAPGLLSDDEPPPRSSEDRSTEDRPTEGRPASDESHDGRPSRDGSRPKGNNRTGLLFASLAAAAIALEIVPSEWASIRLVDDLGLAGGRAGLGFVAVTAGMVIGRFSGDTLTGRWGPARLSSVATTTSILGTLAGALSPVAWGSIVGFGFAGLGAAVLFPRLYDDAAQTPGRPGAMLGAMTAGLRVGAFVIPVTVGSLAATSSFDVGTAMIVVTVPAAVAMLVLRGRRR